ncbi:hypothetical protein PIB30_061337 [Stylosanthes scabra]|uniref:R13L1/DRL21-like LRR repeat region domain-containing protein n=1 Tax=Stylosanthes scabra TaxID=79078 RepID=A0ABU6YJP5_9FABA|nr:hypothetical protein [Stylosanthes scabra]
MLPSRMQDLVNLHHLDIRGADLLKEMSNGMSNLKHLNFLSDYIVGKHEENGIRELGTLDNLHGSLCISNLENVNNSREALGAKIGNKKHINILELKWDTDGEINIDDVEKERNILNELQPHENLKELSIEGYRGEIFPDWLGLSWHSNITKLSMNGCKNCRQLPSLGQLPSLQYLKISGLEWHFPNEFDGFPKLRSHTMKDCPELSGDLPAQLSALEELTICQCEKLACSFSRAPKLHQLYVMGDSYPDKQQGKVVISGTQLTKSACLPHIQEPRIQKLKISECLATATQVLNRDTCGQVSFTDIVSIGGPSKPQDTRNLKLQSFKASSMGYFLGINFY